METSAKSKIADGGMVIPCTSDSFIRAWLEILRPIHNLSNREMDVFAGILIYREEIAQKVKDVTLIDKLLFNKESKTIITQRLGISEAYFKMIMHKLKQSRIVKNNTIDLKYVPIWTKGKPYRWMFIFQNEDR